VANTLPAPGEATSGSLSPTAGSNAGAAQIGVGSVLQDTYQITKLIGQGGMGTVWQARHLRLPDKRVAIKLLLGERVSEELFARFRREADVTSKLGHPNIVGVIDFNTLPGGAPYIVLEYLDGESLAKRIERGPLPLREVVEIVGQIGSALYAAHRAEIVHRDLKPDNVFLVPTEPTTTDGAPRDQVKVLDFGISKIKGSMAVKTQESAMLGTPQYMSPEQANGKNSEVDARSDVWALGAIVYEMLTGRCAFGGESLPQVLVKIVAQPSPSLREVPGIPAHVAEAVDRALAKEPADRFQDVRSFLAALTGKPPQTQSRGAST
jgi:serine/threonine-protein kinase